MTNEAYPTRRTGVGGVGHAADLAGEQRLVERHLPRLAHDAVLDGEHHHPGERVASHLQHHRAVEPDGAHHATAGLVRHELLPVRRVVVPHVGERDREVLRAVVVRDHEPVATADHHVVDVVLDAVAPGRHQHGLGGRVVQVERPHLAGGAGRGTDQQEAVARRGLDADPEPLVRIGVHDGVVAGRGAEHVPAHLVRTPRVVDDGVVQRSGVAAPGRAVEHARHLVREHLAGAQVLDPQGEPLVALQVDGVGEQVVVGAHRQRAEREERVPLGLGVAVDEHLLAGRRDAGLDRRRRPARGVLDRSLGGAAAAHRVLAALGGARVVPPRAPARRHRQVGLLGARHDLVVDRPAQPLEVRGLRCGVGVLGLEVRDHRGVGRVAQPLVGVDDVVAVVAADGVDPGGGRGGGGGVGHRPSLRAAAVDLQYGR